MSEAALVIIYNHRYDKNIDILERLYNKRFSHIYHLVPFYDGEKPNVIPVYENSFYFQSYIAQGLKSYFNENYKHYFFIGDDLLLNPVINENNYKEYLRLNDTSCFLPGYIYLHESKITWARINEAYNYKQHHQGLEIDNQLPDYNTALKAFAKHNVKLKSVSVKQIHIKNPFSNLRQYKKIANFLFWKMKHLNTNGYSLPYPLVAAYSDIFVVSSNTIKLFCHYCGLFAATKLFVELAIPTALVLSADTIITENDLDLKGKALWRKEDFTILDKYDNQIDKLLQDFPATHLYLHPVKLSKWKSDL
jgi:hypothetical protein